MFYAFVQYIFGTHAACPEACADYSTRKEFTPQKQNARDPFVSRLALKESRVSFWLYAPENGPPAALHALDDAFDQTFHHRNRRPHGFMHARVFAVDTRQDVVHRHPL